jgi:hypothetical protein
MTLKGALGPPTAGTPHGDHAVLAASDVAAVLEDHDGVHGTFVKAQ